MSKASFDDVTNYWTKWVDVNEGPMIEEETEDEKFYNNLKNMNLKDEMERKEIERLERMERIRIEVKELKGEPKSYRETKLKEDQEKNY